jgi:hypothetical protein
MVQKIKYTLTSEQDISNKLGQAFSKNSSTEITIQNSEMLKVKFKIKEYGEYNCSFSLDELRKSLNKAHDTACGLYDVFRTVVLPVCHF